MGARDPPGMDGCLALVYVLLQPLVPLGARNSLCETVNMVHFSNSFGTDSLFSLLQYSIMTAVVGSSVVLLHASLLGPG